MTASGTLVDRVATPVAIATVVALGLSAGAMLTEAVVLVSYWRALPPADFLAWFAANEPRLVAFFGPLQTASAALATAATALFALRRRPGGACLGAAAALAVAALGTYFLYFRDVNASFAAGTIAPGDVASELGRWAAWQWLRTGIGAGAFVAAIAAVRDRGAAPR